MDSELVSIDYEKIIRSITLKNIVRASVISSAIALTLSPLVLKHFIDRSSRGLLLGAGLGFSVAACTLKKPEYENKMKKTYEDIHLKQHRDLVVGQAAKLSTQSAIANEISIAEFIEETVPDFQLSYFAGKFGVTPLISKFYIDADEEQAEPERQAVVVSSDPLRPTIYTDPEADLSWLHKVAYDFTLPQGKRLIEHILVAGESQSGKSTLVALLLSLIHAAFDHQKLSLTINLIDPKFPMSDTAYEPSWKGYAEVMPGMRAAIAELKERKKSAVKANKLKEGIPKFNPYITILDELDTSYGNSKGYGKDITKEEATELIGLIRQILNEGAAYNVRFIGIGQSPLTTDNGLNRSVARQATRIVLGDAARAWCNDPQFPFKKLANYMNFYRASCQRANAWQ